MDIISILFTGLVLFVIVYGIYRYKKSDNITFEKK